MKEPTKPFCPVCVIVGGRADKYQKKYQALQALLYHTKENLADCVALGTPVQASVLFEFIENRLRDIADE